MNYPNYGGRGTRYRRHSGFALLIILVFMQIFTLFTAEYLMSKTKLKQRMKLELSVGLSRDQALFLLSQWAKKKSFCDIKGYSIRFLQQQSENWWRSHACDQVPAKRVYIIQERLMTNGCVAVSSNPLKRVQYVQSTVYVAGSAGVMLQETSAESSLELVDCNHPVTLVASGRLSRRWLS